MNRYSMYTRCRRNGIIKVCAKCYKPTKKQFRTVCKACGHDRWAPPNVYERLALAYAKSTSAPEPSQVAAAEEGAGLVITRDLAGDSLDAAYYATVEHASVIRNSADSHAASCARADVVKQTSQLDFTQLNKSSAFVTTNVEEAIKFRNPFGRPNASRSDKTDSSECPRVRIGPRRRPATRSLRGMQMILRKESSESRSNRQYHVATSPKRRTGT